MTGRLGGSSLLPMTREDRDDLWDARGDHLDPMQVPMLEALWRIGEPLSAICMVDVLDGYLSMWEAADHLEALQELDIVEPASSESSGDFGVPYRLKTRA
jgi:hypothetical protein